MTTIAYRDGVLAVDSRAYSGDRTPIGVKRKLVEMEDGSAFAVTSAHPGLAEVVKRWMLSGMRDEYRPAMKDSEDFDMLFITNDRRVFFMTEKFEFIGPLEADFHAIGSGCREALGAMQHGATAEEAVAAAAAFDMFTGLPVHTTYIPDEFGN